MMLPSLAGSLRAAPVAGALLVLAGCGGDQRLGRLGGGGIGDASGGAGGGAGGNGGAADAGFVDPNCPAGGATSLTGIVYSPAGDLPLHNVLVYVPRASLVPFSEGAGCYRCDTVLSDRPIAHTFTDMTGRFTLQGLPPNQPLTLVMQVGKWRRQVTLPALASCVETALSDPNLTRLPRNKAEGEIPRIALSTGGADSLECLFRKLGVDDSEFTPESGMGRINLYADPMVCAPPAVMMGGSCCTMTPGGGTSCIGGSQSGTDKYTPSLNGGAAFSLSTSLWDNLDNLKKYDIVVLSCEGQQNPATKSATALQALQDFANLGGRVFASHWHNYWIDHGPAPWPTIGTFNYSGSLPKPFVATVDTSFGKGMALAEWLVNVGASTTPGKIEIIEAKQTLDDVNPMVAQRWIYNDAGPGVQYVTFDTPMLVKPEMQCGRVVFTDIHVSAGDNSSPSHPFPAGCTTVGLTPQEKVLIFMIFDLSACINPGGTAGG